MDEPPVSFDILANYSVDVKGTKRVLVNTTGHGKCRFTVVLSCMADGTKLPPTVILKRKILPKGLEFPSCVIVHAQEKEWMDGCGTFDWLEFT